MFQHVVTAYRQLVQSQQRSARRRKSVALYVRELEERTTPAAPIDFMPRLDPPVISMIAVASQSAAPVRPALASDTSVRTDLFGMGGAEVPDEPDELEQWFSDAQSERMAVGGELAEPSQENDDAGADESGTVIIEDMVFVPRVD